MSLNSIRHNLSLNSCSCLFLYPPNPRTIIILPKNYNSTMRTQSPPTINANLCFLCVGCLKQIELHINSMPNSTTTTPKPQPLASFSELCLDTNTNHNSTIFFLLPWLLKLRSTSNGMSLLSILLFPPLFRVLVTSLAFP